MPDVFITLEEAATFEGIKYNTLVQRMKRNPEQYRTQAQAQEGGGKDRTLISTSSLSAKAIIETWPLPREEVCIMIDVRQFTREVTEAFVARYPERFNGSEDSVFTEDLARMMAMVAALAIEKYDRERQQ